LRTWSRELFREGSSELVRGSDCQPLKIEPPTPDGQNGNEIDPAIVDWIRAKARFEPVVLI
jgi:hypothetical protein